MVKYVKTPATHTQHQRPYNAASLARMSGAYFINGKKNTPTLVAKRKAHGLHVHAKNKKPYGAKRPRRSRYKRKGGKRSSKYSKKR